jgi:hypothetical protein
MDFLDSTQASLFISSIFLLIFIVLIAIIVIETIFGYLDSRTSRPFFIDSLPLRLWSASSILSLLESYL